MTEPTNLFTDLSPAAQTNFAELFEQSLAATVNRSITNLPGSFNKKTIKGVDYWYWQVRDLQGVNRQVYLGPNDDRLSRLVKLQREGKASTSRAADDWGGLAGACVSLGCMPVMAQHFAVINRMAEYGFFRAGGVLVGTHAFIAMANMLGVRWTSGWRTSDVDVAHSGKNVTLALADNATADRHDAITSLEMGLLPQQSLANGHGATYITAKKDIRVDLLTTAGRKDEVYRYEPLNVSLQPLKFMEFSLEHTTQTVLISGEQAVVVNIPSPMRYALHKLVIMGEREEAFRTKVAKDAGQVAALAQYGLARSPAALKVAAHDLMSRGPGWRSRAAIGLKYVAASYPEVAQSLGSVLKAATPQEAYEGHCFLNDNRRMRTPNRDVVNVAEINPHAPRPYTFTEAALCLQASIRAAGYRCELYINRTDSLQRTIVLGALPPNLHAVDNVGTRNAVIYNFEQMGSESIVIGNEYVPWLSKWLVADYHSRNVEWLRASHPDSIAAMELPIVPHSVIAFQPETPIEPEFDVLFFGTPTPRREAVLQGLRDAGLSVEVVAGAFANELMPAILRARMVLHVHFYETGLFPVARILQPVAQGVPIVCETSIQSALGDWSQSGIVFAPYDELVQACRDLLAVPQERTRRARDTQSFAAAIDFKTPFERLLEVWDNVPGVMPPAPATLPPPTASPAMPPMPAMSHDDAPLTNEEIEAILHREAHELPPEAHLAPPPLKIAERQPGKGPYGALVVWLLVIFSIYTIWQTMR